MTRGPGLQVWRPVRLPDPVRLARYARAPELGPKILFFGGGSGPNPICRELVPYTHNTIHLITPFDSGGSSAKLRQAFHMPAVGDLRNRMMALCDQSVRGNAEVRRLFGHRLPAEESPEDLSLRLERIVAGGDELMAAIPDPLRKIIRNHLGYFKDAMPPDFDLRGASLGNLVLAGGYLNNGRHLDPVLYMFSKLAEVRGVVRPVVNLDLHLYARLADSSLVLGQHLLTGREVDPLSSAITELGLCQGLGEFRPARAVIRDKVRKLIAEAELICYPVGSFYTSLLASLLPDGLGAAVAGNLCPKVFIPGTGRDPEVLGGGLGDRLSELCAALGADERANRPEGKVLDYVLLDRPGGEAVYGAEPADWKKWGLTPIAAPLCKPEEGPRLSGRLTAEALLSLV